MSRSGSGGPRGVHAGSTSGTSPRSGRVRCEVDGPESAVLHRGGSCRRGPRPAQATRRRRRRRLRRLPARRPGQPRGCGSSCRSGPVIDGEAARAERADHVGACQHQERELEPASGVPDAVAQVDGEDCDRHHSADQHRTQRSDETRGDQEASAELSGACEECKRQPRHVFCSEAGKFLYNLSESCTAVCGDRARSPPINQATALAHSKCGSATKPWIAILVAIGLVLPATWSGPPTV